MWNARSRLSQWLVAEVIDAGVTGEVVDSVAEAICKIGSVLALDRGRVRRRFEMRFSAARMAQDYTNIYRKLIGEKITRGQDHVMPRHLVARMSEKPNGQSLAHYCVHESLDPADVAGTLVTRPLIFPRLGCSGEFFP